MKVLLTKNVAGLGKTGDVKEVSDGHARNFLIPRHLALPATSSVLAQVQKEEKEHQEKLKRQQERFEDLKHKIENKTFTVKAKADKQNLFAAVKEVQIAEALQDRLKMEITKDQIVILKPIKSLGLHQAQIRLAQNPPINVNLVVEQL